MFRDLNCFMAKFKGIFLGISLLFVLFSVYGGVITIDGTYQGEALYIQNPISSDKSFCITEVYVNDIPYYEINSTAFEINLSNLNKGDYINIKIVHKDNCRPRILNAEILRSKSTYEIVSFKVDENQVKWTTKNESNEEPFMIERFRNNKWVEI